MKLLIDKSVLQRSAENDDYFSRLLKFLIDAGQTRGHQCWITAADITDLVSMGEAEARTLVKKVLSQIIPLTAMIPLRSFMVLNAMDSKGPQIQHGIVEQAAKSAHIDAVISEDAMVWRDSDFKCLNLDEVDFDKKGDDTVEGMEVPFLDLKAQLHQFYNEVDSRLHEIIHNTSFILGPHVQQFEKDFAAAHEVAHCLGVSTGTDALHIALMALGIGMGDRVLVPVNTFIATAEAVSMVGAEPVFVDCDVYWNIDVDHCGKLLERMASKGEVLPKAIMPVHLYGQPADMSGIMALAEKYDLKVIEDCCQAHLARWKGQRVGSFGDFGAFSFYPGKNLGAFGEAGALVTRDKKLNEKALLLRQHGETKKYHHQIVGHNFRMSALQGAVLGAKLPYLPAWTEKRRNNARLYGDRLKGIDGIQTPEEREGVQAVYHLYVIQAEKRDDLAAILGRKGVATGLHYPVPLHLQPAYAKLGHRRGDFPMAEKAAAGLLSLPMYPELTEAEIDYVCQLIKEFMNRQSP